MCKGYLPSKAIRVLDGIHSWKFTWKDLWGMEASQISFLLWTAYDVLPSPVNLCQWYGEDSTCPLYSSPTNLKHIFVGCKVSLMQVCYTWRHTHVLKYLAPSLDSWWISINALPTLLSLHAPVKEFVGEGAKDVKVKTPDTAQLGGAHDWMLLTELNEWLCFPPEIVAEQASRWILVKRMPHQ